MKISFSTQEEKDEAVAKAQAFLDVVTAAEVAVATTGTNEDTTGLTDAQ